MTAYGMWLIGALKTCHAGFPKAFLRGPIWVMPDYVPVRGDSKCMLAQLPLGSSLINVYAHVWNEPGRGKAPRKFFVSTCGDTLPAEPHIKSRVITDPDDPNYGEIVEKSVKRPTVVKMFHDTAGIIDAHNHLRQGVMAIERNVGTKNYVFRLFCTVFAMSMVDAYKLHCRESSCDKNPPLRDWLDAAAVTLLTNTRSGSPAASRSTMLLRTRNKHVDVDDEDDLPLIDGPVKHTAMGIAEWKELVAKRGEEVSNSKSAVRCQYNGCGRNCYIICVECSRNAGKAVGFCGLKTQTKCIEKHQQEKGY